MEKEVEQCTFQPNNQKYNNKEPYKTNEGLPIRTLRRFLHD